MNTPKTDALMRDENRDGNDLPALCRQMEEGLRLAASILEKIPTPTLDLACRRAAIRHNADTPMEFIRDILANDKPHPVGRERHDKNPKPYTYQ